MLLMCGTAERRGALEARIQQLAAQVDYEVLAAALGRQRLLPLVGKRLAQHCPEALPPSFVALVREAATDASRRNLVFRTLTAQALRSLEAAGVTAVPLKGELMAQELYGDDSLRASNDIDLLVPRDQLRPALLALSREGYVTIDDDDPASLPELHYRLVHTQTWRPLLELHWRIHWYETAYSSAALERSRPSTEGGCRLSLQDELAALLLFFARDGVTGLRYPADIAAWWDRYGAESGEPPLDPVLDAHEELRDALLVAAAAAGRLVGLPLDKVRSASWRPRRRALLALRLLNWTGSGSSGQVGANRTLIEWMLSPRGQTGAFVRRRLIPPATEVRRMYRLPDRAPIRLALRRVTHGPKLVLRYALAVGSRAGRPGASLPPSMTRPPEQKSFIPAAVDRGGS